MIITCEQCDKKFEIESTLIPEKGRLLQCSSCTHQWFYKKDILEETEVVIKKQDIKSKKNEPPVEEINNIKVFEDLTSPKKLKRKHSYTPFENKKIRKIFSKAGNELDNENRFNVQSYPKMKEETRKSLLSFFKPYNEELFKFIGKRFEWDV